MKGIILAGGTGSRLYPLTRITNKHLLPIYNSPMIFYPLHTLREAGIKEVMIVSGQGHSGNFLELLGSGKNFDMNISYEVQEEPGGIAQALGLAKNFINKDEKFMVLLGDNIIEDNLAESCKEFESGKSKAKIFLKKVDNPKAYGVANLKEGKIEEIEEKPAVPRSDMAVVGCYMYDSSVFEVIADLKPSERGELEITDVNNHYLKKESLEYDVLNGFWGDCGESFERMHNAAALIKDSRLKNVAKLLK
jgi:glucose-1-phosphate thymidylyltransferase